MAEGRIFLIPGEVPAGRLIGECPRCGRFVCDRHCELLDLSGENKRSWLTFGRPKPKPLVACCPFDPGVALGGQL